MEALIHTDTEINDLRLVVITTRKVIAVKI